MITLPKKKEICPLCGNLGKKFNLEKEDLKNCPICGTVFNEFGIILTQEIDDETLRRKVNNN